MWLSRYWLGFTLSLLLLGVVVSSEPVIGLSVLLLLAGGVAQLWSKHSLDNVRYERIIPEPRGFPGERMAMTLRLINDKVLPVPLIELRDAFPEGVLENEEHLRPAAFPGFVLLGRSAHMSWYERINWPIEFDAPARGFYRLGPARLSSGDLFGLFPVDRNERGHDSLIIYPRIYSMPELGLPSRRPFGEQRGRERLFEDPSRIAGSREYRPGDPMKRIDWKGTARHQSLMSRVYEPSSTHHLLIALNVHTLAHTWEGYIPELLERLLSTAGSVARYGIEAGYSVGLVANGLFPDSDRPLRIPVGSSSDQLMRILEALAVIGPLTLVPLQTILDREAQSFPFGATLVCVTARMEPELAASLMQIAATGHAVTVLSVAEEEFTEDLGGIPVANLSNAMKSLELRDAAARASTTP
jgi:uncharacterized protein (DUF58 family)